MCVCVCVCVYRKSYNVSALNLLNSAKVNLFISGGCLAKGGLVYWVFKKGKCVK